MRRITKTRVVLIGNEKLKQERIHELARSMPNRIKPTKTIMAGVADSHSSTADEKAASLQPGCLCYLNTSCWLCRSEQGVWYIFKHKAVRDGEKLKKSTALVYLGQELCVERASVTQYAHLIKHKFLVFSCPAIMSDLTLLDPDWSDEDIA